MPSPRAFRPASLVLLGLLTAAALLLRLWRISATPLFADEAYYLLWSGRLAPGYYDHPAAVALLLRASTILGGQHEAGVRWLNAMISAACVPLAFGVGRRYVSPAGGWVAALAVAFGPVYVLTGRIVYPDSIQYALLLLNLLALAPLLESKGATLQWAWFGITLGAFLNVKATSLLYLAALGALVLLWQRAWLRDPRAWLGAALALAALSPWLIWSASHDFPSLRLAVSQGGGFGLEPVGRLGSLAHAWRYLSPPLAVLAFAATLGALIETVRLFRQQGARLTLRYPPRWTMLALAATALLFPMLLSAADSPRNLALGLLPLWPLAALLPGPEPSRRTERWMSVAAAALFVVMAFHAVGTVGALLGPTRLPGSSGAVVIRQDAAGWPEFGQAFSASDTDLIFAVDYSIAGQVSHYSGRPVQSSISQFRYWGVPDADAWTVLAQAYLPPEIITERLRSGFREVTGPELWSFDDADGTKRVYIWRAMGRETSTAELLDALDYLSLAQEARRAAPPP